MLPMTSYLHQPDINPVILHLWGPLQIRWYSLLYVGGFYVGRLVMRRVAKDPRFLFTPDDVDRLAVWMLVSAVIGARIVYCVVYDPKSLINDWRYIFQTYNGGLSFHGGLLGVIVGAIIYGRRHKIPFWNLADGLALSTPTGLAMGRLGNFINGELWGRVSYVPWAMIFKTGGPEPRHPSQLYEFFLEGIVLFAVLWLLRPKLKRDGEISMVFLMGYAVCRFVAEFFREPDAQLGYLAMGLSMGQILSALMFVVSGSVAFYLLRRPQPIPNTRPGKKNKKK
jgi:phosphatidylglycerol---prolipoprotein diacylglyceryl transferase